MTQTWMLYPLFAMALLTLIVALRMLNLRIQSVRSGKLSLGYFRLNQGGEEPEAMKKASQHYANLFEMPVLFYLVVVVIYITNTTSVLLLVLAWLFVGLRVGHAYVHMGYNNVLHRLNVFLLSTFVMYAMWFVWFGQMLLA